MFTLVSGIAKSIIGKTIAKTSVLILGLDGAGKTTLLEKLLTFIRPERKPKVVKPTMGLNTELIEDGKTSIRFWDLGGKECFRAMWFNYLKSATALIYIVNGSDEKRINETRKLFDELSLKFNGPTAIVFLNTDEDILQVFPSADRGSIFLMNFTENSHLQSLYNWILQTAVIPK